MKRDVVAELLDKQSITEVIYRYCRALDRMDREAALSVWHPEGTADYPPFYQGDGAGFVDWVWAAHAAMTGHSHQITNILVEVAEDGDSAVSESYVTVVLHAEAGAEKTAETVVRGRYLDRWSRRDGRWAIDARRHVVDLQTVTLHERAMTAVETHAAASARDRSDPSFGLLG